MAPGGPPGPEAVTIRSTSGDARALGGGRGAPARVGEQRLAVVRLGLLAHDGGQVTLHGAPVTAADRRGFGYMPEERGLYPKMRVLEHIVYLARLHGLSRADAHTRATAILERLGLGERLNDNIEALSLGTYTRPATALLHRLPPDSPGWWPVADWFHAAFLLIVTFVLLLVCFRLRQRGWLERI